MVSDLDDAGADSMLNSLMLCYDNHLRKHISPVRLIHSALDTKQAMSTETYRLLASTLCYHFPLTPVHCGFDGAVVPHGLSLDHDTVFF
jgi:hypothetical protein